MNSGAVDEPTPLEIEIPGHRIAGLRWHADRRGPLVLALHGWLDNAASFASLAPGLERAQLVAVDLPGHGRSSHKAVGCCYHFVDAVADAAAVLEALSDREVVLLGHSMGAGISTLLAGMWPERIAGVCLVEGLGPLTDDESNAPSRLAASVAAQRRHATDRRRVFPDLSAAAQRLELAQDVGEQAAYMLATRGTESVDGGLRWRADPRLRVPSRIRFTEAQVLAFIRAIKAPVRLIRARDGFSFDEATMRARVQAAARLQVVEVDGGHHVHLDHPERVLPVLQALVDELVSTPSDPPSA